MIHCPAIDNLLALSRLDSISKRYISQIEQDNLYLKVNMVTGAYIPDTEIWTSLEVKL